MRSPAYGSGCSDRISLTLSSAFLVSITGILELLLAEAKKYIRNYTLELPGFSGENRIRADIPTSDCTRYPRPWHRDGRSPAVQCHAILYPAGTGRGCPGVRRIHESHGCDRRRGTCRESARPSPGIDDQ